MKYIYICFTLLYYIYNRMIFFINIYIYIYKFYTNKIKFRFIDLPIDF